MKSKITRSLALSTSSLALFLLASCTPYQQQGAAVGALGGAAVGAIAGNDGAVSYTHLTLPTIYSV